MLQSSLSCFVSGSKVVFGYSKYAVLAYVLQHVYLIKMNKFV